MRSAPLLASLSRTRRVMDCVLPSAPVNKNSVCCGLTQVSCVRRVRPAECISTQTPSTHCTSSNAPALAAGEPAESWLGGLAY